MLAAHLLLLILVSAASSSSLFDECKKLPVCRSIEWQLENRLHLRKPSTIQSIQNNNLASNSQNSSSSSVGGAQADIRLIEREGLQAIMKRFFRKRDFEREASVLGCLQHSLIDASEKDGEEEAALIKVYCQMPSRQALVMQWSPLGDYLHSHYTLSEFQFTLIAKELIKTVWKMHAAGWIHHDIKPNNILRMTRPTNRTDVGSKREADESSNNGGVEEYPALIDFGLASPVETGGKPARGTRMTKAPEQFNLLSNNTTVAKKATVTSSAVDWWSLGVSLWFIWCHGRQETNGNSLKQNSNIGDCLPYRVAVHQLPPTQNNNRDREELFFFVNNPRRHEIEAGMPQGIRTVISNRLMQWSVEKREALDTHSALQEMLNQLDY